MGILKQYFNLTDSDIEKQFIEKIPHDQNLSVTQMLDCIIINDLKNNYKNFSPEDLIIIYMYYEMRTKIGYIDFKVMHPILKNGINMVTPILSKKEIIDKISSLLNIDIIFTEEDELNGNNFGSPPNKFMYNVYKKCLSPTSSSLTNDENYNVFDKNFDY